jgi:hypothetical protein
MILLLNKTAEARLFAAREAGVKRRLKQIHRSCVAWAWGRDSYPVEEYVKRSMDVNIGKA